MTRSGCRNQVFGGRHQAVPAGKPRLGSLVSAGRGLGLAAHLRAGLGGRGGQLPCVGSSVIYTESAVLPRQGVRAGLALAVDIQAQGGFCLPVQAEALWL